jgi:hypothetical protein
MEKILESKALNLYENFYLIVSRDKKNFQSLKKKSYNEYKQNEKSIIQNFINIL